MANPQKENGTTQIANEIMDALCRFRIPGEVRQIIDVIIRKTYGWNKKSDWVANSQIVEMTGMLKGNVSRGLSKAITNKLVIKSDNKLKLNKNYEEWISFGKLSEVITNKKLSEVISPVIKSDTKVIKSEGNKYTLTKDTNTKYIPNKNVEYLLSEESLKNDYKMLSKNINVNSTDIKRKAEQLYNWAMSAKKNRRSNYKFVLRNALIKDFGYTYKS
jgi:phage replication O-like protein O